ncbi:trypsin-like peptidase domain-containing protein [Streptomyces cucumeris]|uniref:VMAP-C domain-containing protein n=1 Tax=Streptomyces cucumeris TaxID=2962890 RepID=UPI003D72850A
MEWFRSAPAPGQRPVTVSVLSQVDQEAVGSGVLLPGGRRFLTCAHVINCALGKEDTTCADPPAAGALTVRVHGPDGGAPHIRTAELTVWIPPGRSRGVEWEGDLAVLDLTEPPPRELLAPRWRAMTAGQSVLAWHASGLAATIAKAQVTSCDGRIGYVDGESLTGVAIDHGYSGGPLWSGEEGAVVGLVAAALTPPHHPATGAPPAYAPHHVARRSWSIPWQRIQDELRRAGAAHVLHEPAPGPWTPYEPWTPSGPYGDGGLSGPAAPPPPAPPHPDPAHRLLTTVLARALADPVRRADCARTVARRCGHPHRTDGSAPSVDEFARLLTQDGRALPALAEVLHPAAPRDVAELLAAGRMSGVPRLLSPGELEELLTQFARVPLTVAARLPSVVRSALPLAELPGTPLAGSGWTDPDAGERAVRVRELIGALEGLRGDSRPVPDGTAGVPGLLRVVTYVAALCPADPGEALRRWSTAVAVRLGIHPAALEERRADAHEWAERQRTSAAVPRVLVRLTAHPGQDGTDRYRLRMWCDEGEGPRRVSGGGGDGEGGPPRSAAQAAEDILTVIEPLHRALPAGVRPVIELIVDREALELPVDQWEWPGPAGLVPGVLGAEYPLVVHCPELLQRAGERFKAALRHRWQRLDDGGAVHIDGSTGGAHGVYALLMDHLDAGQATVDGVPAEVRIEIVQVCLAMGMPVVVWDRDTDAESGSHAVRAVAGTPPRRLPETVRAYRARTLGCPRTFLGRPVLAWAEADRELPRLELADPTEPS